MCSFQNFEYQILANRLVFQSAESPSNVPKATAEKGKEAPKADTALEELARQQALDIVIDAARRLEEARTANSEDTVRKMIKGLDEALKNKWIWAGMSAPIASLSQHDLEQPTPEKKDKKKE